jgi:AcrR family transcriptional regulator
MPGSPRGRPRSFDREAALDRAMEAFWKRGYAGVSLADLTQITGIHSPSLYAAFGSKYQLFREAVARYLATHGAFAARALREEATARDALARLLHDAAEAYAARGKPRGCLVVSGATNCPPEDERAIRFLVARRAATEKAIQSRLERALAERELPRGTDPVALAAYFAAVVDGISIQARDGVPRGTLHTIASTAMSAWPDAGASRGPGGRRRRSRSAGPRRGAAG